MSLSELATVFDLFSVNFKSDEASLQIKVVKGMHRLIREMIGYFVLKKYEASAHLDANGLKLMLIIWGVILTSIPRPQFLGFHHRKFHDTP
ncbi:hypothetical protein GCM10028791_12400 [Echinicola sediminis]